MMHYAVLDDALSTAYCAELVSMARNLGFKQAKVAFSSGPTLAKAIRNNDRIAFTDSSLALRLWETVRNLLEGFSVPGKPVGLNPNFRFYRYSEGQRFKPHKDGVVVIDENLATRITVLFYLNEDFEGGQTILMPNGMHSAQASSRIIVKPQTGRALLFEHQTWHEGVSVSSGIKYVLRSDVIYEKR